MSDHLSTCGAADPAGEIGTRRRLRRDELLTYVVADALAPFGVRVTELPVTPSRLVALLDEAAAGPAPRP